MGLAEVLTRIRRIDNETTQITIDDNSVEPQFVIDDELSSVSTNPVQNRVITNRINSISGTVSQNSQQINTINQDINALTNEVQTKQPYSVLIRNIWVGTDIVPSNSVGQNGDLYIYRPEE